MNTTNLFIEILIIGIGAFIAMLVVVATSDWLSWAALRSWIETLGNGVLLVVPFVVYFLGILVDRLSDSMLIRQEVAISKEMLANERFPRWESSTDIKRSRIFIYATSDTIARNLDYTRSKIRICRGWVLNALLLVAALFYYGLTHASALTIEWKLLFCTATALALLNYWAWSTLTAAEYHKIYDYDLYLREARLTSQSAVDVSS